MATRTQSTWLPTTRRVAVSSRTSIPQKRQLSTRHKLLIWGIGCILLSLFAIFHVQSVYNGAYQQFENIVFDSSVQVDASIQAVQQIASVNKYAADYIALATPTTPNISALTPDTRATLYTEFQGFRDQMFTLRNGAKTVEEIVFFQKLEEVVYQEYWPQISLLIAAQQNKNRSAALQAFNAADAIFEKQIAPAMLKLEQQNYNEMLKAADNARNRMYVDTIGLGMVMALLAVALTVFSFWLRFKVRRFFTPSLDLAAILAWFLVVTLFSQLVALPEQLRVMVQDAYYSVTASARVIADANRINVTESAALNDPPNAEAWQNKFDQNVKLVTLRLCGQANCIRAPFSAGSADKANQTIVNIARKITPQDSDLIDRKIPLMGNITFAGEVATLEQARKAFTDYLVIDVKTRALLDANQLEAAIILNTGKNTGQSDEAFLRFQKWMEQEKAINRGVFEHIWQEVQRSLPATQVLYGVGGYLLVMLLCAGGVYHRHKEL